MAMTDEDFLRRALELAEGGRGHVEPNPLVGAVVVHDGRIVAEGWHARFGGPHAEQVALDQAGERARDATLYVTLEPCRHHGKTPPCTEAVLKAGVRRVVICMTDPFPETAGQGIARLRAEGLQVDVGLLEDEARRLNAPYLKLLATGLPYVHAKWAMTLDGKIASAAGDSRWISGEESRRTVHALRGRVDAIVVGLGTVLADDPLLTARPPGPRTPTRVVLDSRGRLPTSSRLVQTAREVPLLVCVSPRAGQAAIDRLGSLGCEVLVLDEGRGRGEESPGVNETPLSVISTLDARLSTLLGELGRRRMTNVLVEGGGRVLGSFFDARLIDAVHVFIAPKLVGGSTSQTPLAGRGLNRLGDAVQLAWCEMTRLGEDVYLRGALRSR